MKNKLLGGMIWSFIEKAFGQFVTFIMTLILARLLDPKDYGIIAIVMIFISFCDAFVTGGFGNSLVQKKDSDELDFNTILICSVSFSIISYIALFFAAPYISIFYKTPILKKLIRVLGLRIPISGFNSLQQARVQKDFVFKKSLYSTLIGNLIGSAIGIILAINGAGIWALVAQNMASVLASTLCLAMIHKWKYKFEFSLYRAVSLLKFGWKLFVTTIVYTIENNLRGIIIGKVFGTEDLAYYDRGKSVSDQVASNFLYSISKVMFPAMVEIQDDNSLLKDTCRKGVRIGLFVICPILLGVISVSKTFVVVVLTEKWLQCVPFIRIISCVFLIRLFGMVVHQAILAMGRSDIILFIEIIMNGSSILFICYSVFVLKSVICIAISEVIVEVIGLLMYSIFIKRLVGYEFIEQFCDIFPVLGCGLFMAGLVYLVGFVQINLVILLIIQVLVGAFCYIGGSLLIKSKEIKWLIAQMNSK